MHKSLFSTKYWQIYLFCNNDNIQFNILNCKHWNYYIICKKKLEKKFYSLEIYKEITKNIIGKLDLLYIHEINIWTVILCIVYYILYCVYILLLQ